MASAKIKVLGRIKSRLNLSQAKILYNSFILSQFNYSCLVWMFCSKTLQNKINQIQKKALPIVCNDPNLNLDKLVELDKSTTIHIKNNHRKKTNRAVVFSSRPFPNILKHRDHRRDLPTIRKTRLLQTHIEEFS